MSSPMVRTTNRILPYLPYLLIALVMLILLAASVFQVWGGIDKQGGLLYFITKWQVGLNREIAIKIKSLRDTFSPEVFSALLVTSFLYGVLHAVGPGHGKTIISGWAISHPRTLREVALVSSLATFFHAFSSVALVGGIHYFLGRHMPSVMAKLNDWLYITAGVLLVLSGMQTLYLFHQEHPSRKIDKDTDYLPGTVHPLWIAASIGIVPCPLAAVIFLFCLSSGLLFQGVVLVSAFAVGMGLTLFSVAFTVRAARRSAARAGKESVSTDFIRYIYWLSGLLFIILGFSAAWPAISRIL